MIQLAANLSMLFCEVPFIERYSRAAVAGFKGVECLLPYDHAPANLARELRSNQLTQVLINAPAGDWAGGDRGFAALPGHEQRFRCSLAQALPYVDALELRQIHVMAGIAPCRDATCRKTYLSNLEYAARLLESRGVTVLIEPLNPRSVPGYFLNDFEDARLILRELSGANVRLQFDIFHRQILHGDVVKGLRELLPSIGHIQLAGVPDRHEPDEGELSVPFLFKTLSQLNYAGWVGCEYNPRGTTEEGLVWMARCGLVSASHH